MNVILVESANSTCIDHEDTEALQLSSCNLAKKQFFIDAFTPCIGKESCVMNFTTDATKQIYPKAPCKLPGNNTSLFIEGVCSGAQFTFKQFGRQYSISRTTLTYVIVGCNMGICLMFVLNWVWIIKWIEKEEKSNDRDNVQITDFAVCIKNLPTQQQYGTSK